MLVKDQDKILEHQRAARREAAEERQRRNLIDDMRSNTITVESDAGRDVTVPEAQFGRAMSADTVIAKLKRMNTRLYFERSNADPTKYGVYLTDPQGKTHTTPQGEILTLVHICGMEAGINPEFSILHKATKKMPNPELIGNKKATREVDWLEVETVVGETRGWRTVLVRLLHNGFITEGDVEKHFGWNPSRPSAKWQAQTT